ncbi:MAG TPA: hypothetical protein VLT45_15785, partial [Kofleriaceae bacterium]|nr:hypothetical protein [Kofleriaceae bacterium]
MLEGALIGLVVGIAMVIVRSIQGGNAAVALKQALAARRTGGIAAARAVLDPKLKRGHAQRAAGFALIDDRESIEAELGSLTDPVKQGHARAVALLALGALGDHRRLQELASLAEQFERDASRMWKLMKTAVRDIATIGRVLAGAPSSELDKVKPDVAALQDAWVKL